MLGIQTSRIRRVAHAPTTIDGLPVVARKGAIYYFDGSKGGNGNGTSWSDAANSMASIFAKLVGGETIFVAGKVTEQLVTPVQVFDVSVIGVGNRPRHADATPSGGNKYASQWAPPASGAVVGKATVNVIQQGWLFENILFTMESATAPGIQVSRNAASGNDERDGSHTIIRGCKFAGAGLAIRFGEAGVYTENVHNVLIQDNDFLSNSTAISGQFNHSIKIYHNRFQQCTNDIVMAAAFASIVGNTMSLAPTSSIKIDGGTGSNQVHGNYLSGTYADGTLYNAGASDNWNGNYASTGVTSAVPS